MPKPGRTMITLAVEGLIGAGTVLRQVAGFTPSVGEGKMTADKQEDLLMRLRSQYENARKFYNFALINAKVRANFKLCLSLVLHYYSRVLEQPPELLKPKGLF